MIDMDPAKALNPATSVDIRNLCFGEHSYPTLYVLEDGEVRLFLLQEIDPSRVLEAMPDAAGHFRCVH